MIHLEANSILTSVHSTDTIGVNIPQVETIGPLPASLSQRADAKKREMIPRVQRKLRDLVDVVAEAKERNRNKDEHTDQDYELFIDLIKLMLTYEPSERVKPQVSTAPPPTTSRCTAAPHTLAFPLRHS